MQLPVRLNHLQDDLRLPHRKEQWASGTLAQAQTFDPAYSDCDRPEFRPEPYSHSAQP